MKKLYFLAFLALAGCDQSSLPNKSDTQSETQAASIPAVGSLAMSLGQAYDKEKRKIFNLACVQGEEELVQTNAVKAELKVEQNLGFKELLHLIEGSISADTSISGVKIGGGVNVALKNASNGYNETIVLNMTSTPRSRKFKTNSMRPSEKGAEVIRTARTQVLDRCGDEFVSQIDYGASLVVMIRVDYSSSEARQKFGGSLTVDAELVKVKGDFNYDDQEAKKNINVTVEAMQKGGDPTQLLSIIPNSMMKCGIDNLKNCTSVAEELIKYAKGDFKKQLEIPDNKNFNPIVYQTSRYDDAGVWDLLSPNPSVRRTAMIAKAVLDMSDAWENRMTTRAKVGTTLSQWSKYIGAAQLAKLQKAENDLWRDAINLANTIESCENTLDKSCPEWAAQTLASQSAFDPAWLEVSIPTDKTQEDNTICQAARILGRRDGRLSNDQFVMWTRMNRAPLYPQKGRRDLGYVGMGPCGSVVDDL